MTSENHWGPFDPNISACERIARLRALRVLTRLITGKRGEAVSVALLCAEDDVRFLDPALRALESLAALDKRRIWSSYLSLINQRPECAA